MTLKNRDNELKQDEKFIEDCLCGKKPSDQEIMSADTDLALSDEEQDDKEEDHRIHPIGSEHHEVLTDDDEQLEEFAHGKDNRLVLNTVVYGVIYVVLIFAFFLFWTGHNAPGGGFIAGLMTAAVVVLMYVSFGSSFIKNTLKFDFKYLIAIGLTLSLGCGIGGILCGEPFLTHTFIHLYGRFGELELATATIFDLGVYLTVTGGCVTIITSIGESGFKRDSQNDKAAHKPHGE